jgi:PKD repeat protein
VRVFASLAGLAIQTPSKPVVGLSTPFAALLPPTGPVTYTWTFGDGGTASGQTPSHTFARPGTYTVTLTASNGLSTETRTVSIAVSANRRDMFLPLAARAH